LEEFNRSTTCGEGAVGSAAKIGENLVDGGVRAPVSGLGGVGGGEKIVGI
jgi:hypothetical protein